MITKFKRNLRPTQYQVVPDIGQLFGFDSETSDSDIYMRTEGAIKNGMIKCVRIHTHGNKNALGALVEADLTDKIILLDGSLIVTEL